MPRTRPPCLSRAPLLTLAFLLLAGPATGLAAGGEPRREEVSVTRAPVPPIPGLPEGTAIARLGPWFVAAGGIGPDGMASTRLLGWKEGEPGWTSLGDLPVPAADAAVAGGEATLWIAGAGPGRRDVVAISLGKDGVVSSLLPTLGTPLPPLVRAGATRGGQLLLPDGEGGLLALDLAKPDSGWRRSSPAGTTTPGGMLVAAFDRLVVLGSPAETGSVLETRLGWRPVPAPPGDGRVLAATALGESHVAALVDGPDGIGLASYHALTNAWHTLDAVGGKRVLGMAAIGPRLLVVTDAGALQVAVAPPSQRFAWIDHAVVGLYLVGMLVMGIVIARKEKGGGGYFTGGNRLPWWALGMSLFATAASAISLMTMPGKAYSGDWTYFAISITAVLCLPLSLWLVAPLVRRLGITTSNEYLERRYGVAARVVGSVIYSLNQVLARMAPIIFLPSIVLASITGIDIWAWIVVVGVVTTLYTFLGGLAAVVWTDTVQGVVMVATVVGCLVMVLLQLDGPWVDLWASVAASDKLHVLELDWSVTRDTFWLMLLSAAFGSLGGIGDQNFVQRVQAARSLGDTRKAVATQLAVAVPLNVLLFALGTALWLYYRQQPGQLDPLMKTDGVYPFFAAQHLPPGTSGFVVAALLAASMSTISSAICSVANLGVDDFLRRWRPRTTEREALVAGRLLSAVVGALGIAGALYLANTDSKSVWDLALLVSGLILNGVVGFFGLGLLTRRAHELGALLGVAAGMGFVFWLQRNTGITFWLYGPLGSTVTFVVGYVASVVIPWPRKDLAGLTIYTLGRGEAP